MQHKVHLQFLQVISFNFLLFFVRFCFIEKINNNKKQQKKKNNNNKKLNKFSVAGKRIQIHPRPFWNFTRRISGVLYVLWLYVLVYDEFLYFYLFYYFGTFGARNCVFATYRMFI